MCTLPGQPLKTKACALLLPDGRDTDVMAGAEEAILERTASELLT